MQRLHQRARSFWAILLLVLAVSPVTAPFSSCDLENLFSDREAPPGTILQSKHAPDKSVGGVTDAFLLDVRHAVSLEPSICTTEPPRARAVRRFPLRI